MTAGELDRPRVVFARGALVDVLQDARRSGLESAEEPAEPGPVHGRRLRLGEQLRLDEAAQPEFGPESILQGAQRVHQLDHVRADVELVVIEHEPRVAVLAVEKLHLGHDRLRPAGPDDA